MVFVKVLCPTGLSLYQHISVDFSLVASRIDHITGGIARTELNVFKKKKTNKASSRNISVLMVHDSFSFIFLPFNPPGLFLDISSVCYKYAFYPSLSTTSV